LAPSKFIFWIRPCICVPPTVILPYRVSGSTLTAVGRSQLLARWPGTHCRILSGIQREAQTVLSVDLKRTCSRVTSASSALGVLNDYVLYKSTHSLTHSNDLLLRSCFAVTVPTARFRFIPEMCNFRRCVQTAFSESSAIYNLCPNKRSDLLSSLCRDDDVELINSIRRSRELEQ